MDNMTSKPAAKEEERKVDETGKQENIEIDSKCISSSCSSSGVEKSLDENM